jgi:hypothetical protein
MFTDGHTISMGIGVYWNLLARFEAKHQCLTAALSHGAVLLLAPTPWLLHEPTPLCLLLNKGAWKDRVMQRRSASKPVCLLYLLEGRPELATLQPHLDPTVTPQKQNQSSLWAMWHPLVA